MILGSNPHKFMTTLVFGITLKSPIDSEIHVREMGEVKKHEPKLVNDGKFFAKDLLAIPRTSCRLY